MYYKNRINIKNRKFQIWQSDPKAVPVTDIRVPLPLTLRVLFYNRIVWIKYAKIIKHFHTFSDAIRYLKDHNT